MNFADTLRSSAQIQAAEEKARFEAWKKKVVDIMVEELEKQCRACNFHGHGTVSGYVHFSPGYSSSDGTFGWSDTILPPEEVIASIRSNDGAYTYRYLKDVIPPSTYTHRWNYYDHYLPHVYERQDAEEIRAGLCQRIRELGFTDFQVTIEAYPDQEIDVITREEELPTKKWWILEPPPPPDRVLRVQVRQIMTGKTIYLLKLQVSW